LCDQGKTPKEIFAATKLFLNQAFKLDISYDITLTEVILEELDSRYSNLNQISTLSKTLGAYTKLVNILF